MDAKDYMLKVNKICDDYECVRDRGCTKCPLIKHGCKVCEDDEIDALLAIVENYKGDVSYSFERCPSCKAVINLEDLEEDEDNRMLYCPWCYYDIKPKGGA